MSINTSFEYFMLCDDKINTKNISLTQDVQDKTGSDNPLQIFKINSSLEIKEIVGKKC